MASARQVALNSSLVLLVTALLAWGVWAVVKDSQKPDSGLASRQAAKAVGEAILKEWNAEALMRHCHPRLLADNPASKFEAMMQDCAMVCGRVLALQAPVGQAKTFFNKEEVKTYEWADYDLPFETERKKGHFVMGLEPLEGAWKLTSFRIDWEP